MCEITKEKLLKLRASAQQQKDNFLAAANKASGAVEAIDHLLGLMYTPEIDSVSQSES